MIVRNWPVHVLMAGGLIWLLAGQSMAQFPVINSNPASRSLLTTGLDQVYDLQFSAAETTFDGLEKLTPGHPVIDLLRSVSLYYQWFPARTNTALQRQCMNQLELAARKASGWQKAQKKNGETVGPEAMFVYFTAEAMLAKISHYEHETMAAIGYAKNAYPFIQKGKSFQQQYPDFFLSTGLYNYYREVYPEIHPFYKTVAWIMTAGDKKLGMSQLQTATQQALFVRTEALFYLTHLLTDYENKPGEALPYLGQLTIQYPHNPYLRYKYAEALLSANKVEPVPALVQQLMQTKEPVYQQMGTLLKARYSLAVGQRSSARSLADDVLRSSIREESVRAYAYQVLARVARLDGQEKQARQCYKKLLDFAEYPVLRKEAQQ